MALAPGTVVDRYTVDSVLGQGGMAVVYKVKHNQLGSWHALKVLTISSDSIRQRLVQEGRVQASLAHPNIVAVTDILDVNGAPGLVMEYITGSSLDHLIVQNKPDAAEAERLFRGILSGVTHAHALGVVHRDLKPANVMLFTGGGQLIPKVADFGLAKAVADDSGGGMGQTRSGVAMGTPAYMAPEQIRDAKNVDERADVFSLGCILYELFVGKPPFAGPDLLTIFNLVASGEFTPIDSLVPDVPAHIKNAIDGCLQVDRDRRLASGEAISKVLDGEPWQLVAPPAPAMGNTISVEDFTGDAALGSVAMSGVPQEGQAAVEAGGSDAGTGTLAPNTQGALDATSGSLKPVSSPSIAGTAAKGGLAVMGLGTVVLGGVALLGLVGVGLAGGWYYAQTSAAARMHTFLQLRTNGEVTFQTLAWRPGGVTLTGVRVTGADGQPVAAIGKVRLDGSWGAGEWELSHVELRGFQGDLRRNEQGWVVPEATAALLTGNIKARDAGFVINVDSLTVPDGKVKYRGAEQDLEMSWDALELTDFVVSARDPAGWDTAGGRAAGLAIETDQPLLKATSIDLDDGVVSVSDAQIWATIGTGGWVELPEAMRWQVVKYAGGFASAPIREPWYGLDATWLPGHLSQLKLDSATVHLTDRYNAYPEKDWEVVLDTANIGPINGHRLPYSMSGRVADASLSTSGDIRMDGLLRGSGSIRSLDVTRLGPYLVASNEAYGVSIDGGVLTADLEYSLMGPAFTGGIEGTIGQPSLGEVPGARTTSRTQRLLGNRAKATVSGGVSGDINGRRFGIIDSYVHHVGDAIFEPAGGAVKVKRGR